MEIKKDFKNSLIGRREILGVVESLGNPGIKDVKENLVKELGADENLVIVKKVGSKFGRGIFDIEAFVYDSQEAKEKVEGKDETPAPAAESAPAEVPNEGPKAEEAPKEEVKEEVKEEKVEASE